MTPKRSLDMKSGWRVAPAALIAGALMMSGCLTVPKITLPEISHAPECLTPTSASNRDVLVGLSVSGGGSRAALFAAGGMEALGRIRVGPNNRSVLEEVSYISS